MQGGETNQTAIGELRRRVDVASGRVPADLVLRGGRVVNVLSGEIHEGDVAIAGERIVGIGRYDGERVEDVRGLYICPGFIDAHLHIESSMLSVPEFARLWRAFVDAARSGQRRRS